MHFHSLKQTNKKSFLSPLPFLCASVCPKCPLQEPRCLHPAAVLRPQARWDGATWVALRTALGNVLEQSKDGVWGIGAAPTWKSGFRGLNTRVLVAGRVNWGKLLRLSEPQVLLLTYRAWHTFSAKGSMADIFAG